MTEAHASNTAFETPASPFHEGEQRIQTRLGVREEIEPWARRAVRSYLPEDHRSFYAQLPFVVVAARDAADRPWATLLAEEPGFLTSPDSRTLRIAALPSAGDALSGALRAGDDVGLLGIELHTRRRNRVNGRLAPGDGDGLVLSVEQSFGNCPQYIAERQWRRAQPTSSNARGVRSAALSPAHRPLIERADTFFIASGFRGAGDNPAFGMDASHRGGDPGFVRVANPASLTFPDYAGNNHFNTLGNLALDPRAGLLFVDFERGDLLQLSGRARIDWDAPEIREFPGARRLVRFDIDEVRHLEGGLPLVWESPGASIRELRLDEKRRESEDVTSFFFTARDGAPLPDFRAGQHLPVELAVPGEATAARRTYSLSSAPGDGRYRISVKRDPRGLVSRHLHDRLEAGAFVSAGAPQGSFVVDASHPRPVVLVSAGVGLTPLVSMLHVLAKRDAPVFFVHGARDGAHHPLRDEVARIAEAAPHVRLHVAYSRPRTQDREGRDFQSVGRIDAALLESLVSVRDADFYLCGPLGFMAAIEAGLADLGVAAHHIHTESFGPSS